MKMKVIEYIKSLNEEELAKFLENLLSKCGCWAECPLDAIAPFCSDYQACNIRRLRMWLNTEVKTNLKGGDDSDET